MDQKHTTENKCNNTMKCCKRRCNQKLRESARCLASEARINWSWIGLINFTSFLSAPNTYCATCGTDSNHFAVHTLLIDSSSTYVLSTDYLTFWWYSLTIQISCLSLCNFGEGDLSQECVYNYKLQNLDDINIANHSRNCCHPSIIFGPILLGDFKMKPLCIIMDM